MIKVLVVGDSHVAQLKLASEKIEKLNKLDIKFFAVVGPVTNKILFQDNVLSLENYSGSWNHPVHAGHKPTDEKIDRWYREAKDRLYSIGETEELDLNLFDVIVLYGGRFLQGRALVDNFSGGWHKLPAVNEYSFALNVKLTEDFIKYSVHYKWLNQLVKCEEFSGCIVSAPGPLPSEQHPSYAEAVSSSEVSLDYAQDLYSEAFKGLGSVFSPLPKSILSKDKKGTDKKYRSGDIRDFSHTNIAGGDILLKELTAQILATLNH